MNSVNPENTLHALIATRKSVRAYASTPIPAAQLMALFEAARWAASSSNQQPWEYIYAHQHQTEAFAQLLDCLNASNQVWAKNAPVLAVSLARKMQPDGKPNKYAWHDVGAANTSLALQATASGLSVHQMGGYSTTKVIAAFNLPPEVEPVSMLAIGYPDSPENLPENLRIRETTPRERKPLNSFVFNTEYKKS